MRLSDFLEDVGRPVAYYPSMARMLGGIKKAVFVCQMAYWKGKELDPDGWMFKSVEEIEKETGLTYKEQIGVRADLVERKLLEEKYVRSEHRLYFRINWGRVNDLWEKFLEAEHMTNGHMPKSQMPPEHMTEGKMASDQREDGICQKVISLNRIPYTTTDITTDNIWDSISNQLKGEMSRTRFLEIVKAAKPISCENGVLIVEEPNGEAREWAEAHMTTSIKKLLVGILNLDNPEVRFVTREEVPA